jgi:hypothetical protein
MKIDTLIVDRYGHTYHLCYRNSNIITLTSNPLPSRARKQREEIATNSLICNELHKEKRGKQIIVLITQI